MKNSLTIEQLGALVRFRDANGKRWKSALLRCWDSGRYPYVRTADVPYLQQVRNEQGAAWLMRAKLVD